MSFSMDTAELLASYRAGRVAAGRARVGAGAADMTDDQVIEFLEREEAAASRKEWDAQRAARRADAIKHAAIEDDMRKLLAHDRANGEAIDVVRAWWKSDRRVLFLAGPVGVGKTVAGAWALAQAAFDAEYDPRELPYTVKRIDAHCIPSRELVRRAFAYRSERDESPSLPTHGVVLLDDVGVQPDSKDRFNAALCVLLDAATAGKMRIVATTNLTPAQLREVLDERTRDRLNDMGKLAVLKGESRRRQDGGFA